LLIKANFPANPAGLDNMKTSHRRLRLLSLAAGLVLVAGCETTNPFIKSPTEQAVARKELNAGIELYNAGDYAGAIKRLSSSNDIWKADKAIQLDALKYMAFSYCVSGHQAQCKQQFEKAVKLDPSFDLAPGEKDHPLWEPVFDKVKKANH
jgi:Tfp pilus assembly protein PilF